MDLTVSRPIKILVLVLVIAGVGGIASMSVLGKSSPAAGSSAPLSVAQVRARAHHAAPTTKTPATKTPATGKTAPAATTPAATTPAAAAPVPKPAASKPPAPKPKPTVAANGLPTILMEALHQHRVVVVSLFDPHSQTDSISYAEARAGAAAANVGFLGVSVLDDTVSAPLTAALPGGGLLPTPGLLFYRGSGTLVQRVDGFADRDAVAQLATAARTAEPVTPTAPAVVAPPAAVAAPVTTTP